MKPGTKLDSGKRDWTLLPWRALAEVVEVLEYGARKYSRDNWVLVHDAEQRYSAALLRHAVAMAMDSNGRDPESGLSHAAHVACNALFLVWFRQGQATLRSGALARPHCAGCHIIPNGPHVCTNQVCSLCAVAEEKPAAPELGRLAESPDEDRKRRERFGRAGPMAPDTSDTLAGALDLAMDERDSARAMTAQLEAKLRETQRELATAMEAASSAAQQRDALKARVDALAEDNSQLEVRCARLVEQVDRVRGEH